LECGARIRIEPVGIPVGTDRQAAAKVLFHMEHLAAVEDSLSASVSPQLRVSTRHRAGKTQQNQALTGAGQPSMAATARRWAALHDGIE